MGTTGQTAAIAGPNLTGVWSLILWGANNALGYVHLAQSNADLRGAIGLKENDGTQLTAELVGTIQGTRIFCQVINFRGPSGVQLPRQGTINGTFNPANDYVEATWQTDLHQSQGRIVLLRFVQEQVPPSPFARFSKTVAIGPIDLNQTELRELAALVAKDITHQTASLNLMWNDRSAIKEDIESAISDPNIPDVVMDMILAGIFTSNNQVIRSATVTLRRRESNSIFVSGDNNTWVEGKASEIQGFLLRKESALWRVLKKHGSNLNAIVFLLLLCTLPSVPSIANRALVSSVTLALLLLMQALWKVTPYAKVYLRNPKPSWYDRNATTLWMTIIGAILGALIPLLVNWFLPGTSIAH